MQHLRFISSHRGYEHGIRNPKQIGFDHQGFPVYDGKYLKAEFQQGGVSPWEFELALKSLVFKGVYEGENLEERMSWFDTELAQLHYGWTDEDVEIAKQRLLNSESLGIDFIVAEQPKVPIPWASYDELKAPDKIVELMHATGTHAGDVLAYERQNKGRQAVIDAVENSQASEPELDEAVVVKA